MRYQDREWQLMTARLSGTASGYAGGPRNRRMTRQEAIDELRDIADEDPAPLADTVAMYATGDRRDWWIGNAVQLLLDAGADPDLVGDYVEVWTQRRGHGFDLGRFAEQLGQTF